MANPDIPLCDLASLNWVSHRVPSSPAFEYQVRKSEKTTEQEVLHLYRCFTHTLAQKNLIELLMWNASHVHKQPNKTERQVWKILK